MSNQKEIGGYFGLENSWGHEFHHQAVAVNSGRGALEFMIHARQITGLWLPDYLCDSVPILARRMGITVHPYSVDDRLRVAEVPHLADGEWFYLVNYFGQLDGDEILGLSEKTGRLIVDNTQAFFTPPIPGISTLYTCRKFFGVADGGYLYTDAVLPTPLPQPPPSSDHVAHLIGRAEGPASAAYDAYRANERRLAGESLSAMSQLTSNLMRGFDYSTIAARRERNFAVLSKRLGHLNHLSLTIPAGPFAYPLLIDGGRSIRPALHTAKAYVPTLWPNVVEDQPLDSLAARLAQDLLPLPVDQRYTEDDMHHLADLIEELHP